MDPQALYSILVRVARDRGQISYLEFAQVYFDATGEWREPHGEWDDPLCDLNVALHEAGFPALRGRRAQGGGGTRREVLGVEPERPRATPK